LKSLQWRGAARKGRAESLTIPEAGEAGAAARAPRIDDLQRNVYCALGMPIDAIGMATVVGRIEAAAESEAPFFLISTPRI
jgi:hypothetical protein